MNKGLLFVVSAPAGCGKDTILNELFSRTDKAGYAVSATTRAPREGEVNGVHYHFLSRGEFENRRKRGSGIHGILRKLLRYAPQKRKRPAGRGQGRNS